MAALAFEARKRDLKGEGKAGRWWSPVELHILPKLGALAVEDVTQVDIQNALKPIWHAKAVTASRALNRLGIVLQHGAAMGLDVDMQATKEARTLHGKQRAEVKHIPAMPWREVPAFYSSLRSGGVVEYALQFVILTACRSGEVRAAHWSEIDTGARLWTVPGDRTKTGREHRVPLSDEALRVLKFMRPMERDGLVFPSVKRGCVSDMAMSMFMRRRGLEARPHGFRSSFRDWRSEATDTPREVAEAALAHVIGSKVERAYARSDQLEKRAVLMQRWADHCAGRGSAVVRSISGS